MNGLKPIVFPPLNRAAIRAVIRARTFSIFGAIIGLQVFLTMALLPVLLYGGSVSVQLANRIFGGSESPGFGVEASIVLLVAVAAGAFLFAVLGGLAGAPVRALSRAFTGSRT